MRVHVSPLLLVLAVSASHAAEPAAQPAPGATRLSDDPRRVAAGLLIDTPLPAAAIDKSLEVLSALRCRYGLQGGVRDDEIAAGRALEEVEARKFTPEDRTRMAERLGVSLAPARCGEACEQFENLVLVRLRMEALERLAATATCGETPRPASP